ncbi:MAG: DM13 domain-containing protein [Candidatus Moranbacteria bacterium]|jgi:hypothetical protein|nr:DM13 domain-containing protein [Candidatus Moranbacteria bacterium]MBP9801047.1 DM13 domain-containing protein [Candidatus Moranbacteria bacterium]
MSSKKIIIALLSIAGAGIAYYALSPLFRNIKRDDPLPVNVNVKEEQDRMPGEESVLPDTLLAANIQGTPAHPASGTVRVVEADGKRYLRYENFKTINGPDLFVYLSGDLEAKTYVNLGELRATEGNVNYEIPKDIDLDVYPYALVWCQQFSVLFNSAKIR